MKFTLLATIILFSTIAFSQSEPKNNLESEKKKIAELEKQLQKKKDDLQKLENTKEAELKRIELEKKILAEKEEKLRAEIESEKPQKQVIDQSPVVYSKSLQSRDWFVNPTSIITLIFSDKLKYDNSTERDRNRKIFYLSGGKNFGYFEVAPSIFIDFYDLDTRVAKTTEYGLMSTLNFIENKAGNDMIPYAFLTYLRQNNTEDWDNTNTNDNHEQINTYNLGGGAKYFPFGQFLALDATLYYRSANGVYSETGFSDQNYKRNGINANLALSVYF